MPTTTRTRCRSRYPTAATTTGRGVTGEFIPKAITNALKDEKIPVYGDGKQVRDWIYAADHCSAIDLILKKGELGETYLVSAGQERRNIDVVLMILRELGKGRDLVKFVKDRPGHDLRYALDAGKLRRELGWRSSVSFEKGLKLTIDYYRELGSTGAQTVIRSSLLPRR